MKKVSVFLGDSYHCDTHLCYCDAEPFDDVAVVVAGDVVVYFEQLVVLLVRLTKFVPAQVSVGQPNDSMLTQFLCSCLRNDRAMQQSMHINRSLSSCHQYVIVNEVPRLHDY